MLFNGFQPSFNGLHRWESVSAVTPPLVIVVNIRQLKSLNFFGVTPLWGRWLCLGIMLSSAAVYWQLSAGLWCSLRWFPLPRGKWWLWILTFHFEIESPDLSGVLDECLSLRVPRAVASFLTRATWLPPLRWLHGTGAGPFMGLGLLRWRLFQEWVMLLFSSFSLSHYCGFIWEKL